MVTGGNGLGKRFRLTVLLLLGILVLGVVGYRFVENTTWLHAVYVVVQVFSTVGLDKYAPISPAGRVYVIVLITIFLSAFTFATSLLIRQVGSGELRRALRQHWREKKAYKMHSHIIICGFGRLGRQMYNEMHRVNREVVVIETDETLADQLAADGVAVINGDATEEEVLLRAGVEHAQGLLAGLPEDADNVFVTLTAKEYNHALRIVTRANSEKSRSKLMFAGAERVVMPQEMGGQRMANALLRPVVAEFLEVVTGESPGLTLDEWQIPQGSPLCGKSVSEARFRSQFDVSVLGIAKSGYGVDIANVQSTLMEPGDTLVLLGTAENLRKLAHTADSKDAVPRGGAG